ncbi:MAG TPA: hypothetical protein VL172_05835 [Kofleriaceae bacterium]|nr:hypothetical protein [Kofleriaceae bacterium]
MLEVNNASGTEVADGVGDACDPDPDTDGDSILFFDGFNGVAPGAQWTTVLGTWTVSGGALHQTGISAGAPSSAIYWNGGTPTDARADIDATVDAILPSVGAGDTNRLVGLLGRYLAGNGTGYWCTEYGNPNDLLANGDLWLRRFNGATGTDLVFDPLSWPMAVADPIRVRMWTLSAGTNRLYCILRRYATNQFVNPGSTDSVYTTGNYGIFTYAVSATFPYFIVYGVPTPP